jgi:hypothetical protein
MLNNIRWNPTLFCGNPLRTKIGVTEVIVWVKTPAQR